MVISLYKELDAKERTRSFDGIGAARRSRIWCAVSHSSAGGAQEVQVNLAEGLAAVGHSVVLLALYPHEKSLRQPPAHIPWRYAVNKRPRNPLGGPKILWNLVRMLRVDRPDFILSALPAANSVLALAAMLSGTGTKVIFSHHTPTETYHPALDWLDKLLGMSRTVTGIVCVSRTVAGSLTGRARVYGKKVRVIPNALPPKVEEHIRTNMASRRLVAARGRVVVATGRLAPQKNYPVLLRAACHMPDVTIRLVGGGPDEEALRTLAKELGVTEKVEFVGFRPRLDALSVLAEADVFVQPSLFEGHSLAIVEAAKAGLPIVVSDVPVQVEGITANDGTLCGILVPPHDDLALAKAITTLLDEPEEYRDYAERSRHLGEGLTFSAMLSSYESLLVAEAMPT